MEFGIEYSNFSIEEWAYDKNGLSHMMHFAPSCGDEECAALDFERRAAGSGAQEKKEMAEGRGRDLDRDG